MAGRGLEKLRKIGEKIIIPTDDFFLYDRDEIDCRIIKFGNESVQVWKDKETGSESRNEHLRIYLRIYQIRRDKNKLKPEADVPNYGTINPQVRWLGEISSWLQKCEEAGDGEEIFRKKFTLRRCDRNRVGATGKYGYLEVTNIMGDPTWFEDDPEKLSSKGDEEKQEASSGTSSSTSSNSSSTESTEAAFEQELVKVYATTSFDGLKAIAKSVGEKFPNHRDKLVKAFETKKYDIACNLVLMASDKLAKAKELAEIWFVKNQDKAGMLLAYASTLKSDGQEDDIPF